MPHKTVITTNYEIVVTCKLSYNQNDDTLAEMTIYSDGYPPNYCDPIPSLNVLLSEHKHTTISKCLFYPDSKVPGNKKIIHHLLKPTDTVIKGLATITRAELYHDGSKDNKKKYFGRYHT